MRSPTSLRTRPLADGFGVEVESVDVRALDDESLSSLRQLWQDQLVLVFRGQELTAEEQGSLAARFGTVGDLANVTPGMSYEDRHVMMIGNRTVNGKAGELPDGEMWFHFDQAYLEVPIIAGLLYAIEVPSVGGNTLFANAAAAYAGLPDELKVRIDGLTAENVYDYRSTTGVVDSSQQLRSAVQPVVVRHPVTGTPSLFVSPLMTRRIVGMAEKDSRALLAELCGRLEEKSYIYEHCWKAGDLVLWDNRCVLHARTTFDAGEARVLRRLSLAGRDAPEAYRLPLHR